MTVTKERLDDTLILLLEGRLDTTTAPQLQTELLPEFDSINHIRLDFKQLAYVSSAGLRVLLLAEKTAKAKNGQMVIVNVSPEVMEVFEMTGLSEILTIEK
jgi:anti-anti-sigma factor